MARPKPKGWVLRKFDDYVAPRCMSGSHNALSCGTFGIKIVDDARIGELSQ
jgi:hypothetical protein